MTVRGIDDDLYDGSRDYFVTVGKARTDDRFYERLPSQNVSLRNDDDEPFPNLSIGDESAGEEAGSMEFTVSLSPKSIEAVAVRYTITNDTAQRGSDYTASPSTGTLIFSPGQIQKTVSVSLIDDDTDEDDEETFTVTLSDPHNAQLNQSSAIGIIRDNDEAALSIIDASAAEGAGSMDFTVSLSPQSAQTVTVEYSIADSTAQEGSDYTASPASGTLTFTSGQTQKTIRVRLIDDNLDESGDEIFTVALSNPQNAQLNQSSAIGIIKDNDEATLRINSSSAGEGAGSLNFTVHLDPRSVQTATAQYSITAGTAQEDSGLRDSHQYLHYV